MSSFFILSLAVQVGLIVHVIRTGRNIAWIFAIGLLPLAGTLAYVVIELLPSLLGGRSVRRARSSVGRLVDPDRDLRRAMAEVELSGNVDARRRLGDELLERKQCAAAAEVYRGGLKGVFEHDTTLLLGLAQAEFGSGAFADARATLERLREHNADFKSPQAELLYARTLEALDALEEAEPAYASAAAGYPGAEARLRHALLLKRRGKAEEARQVFKDLLDGARLGPPHYRRDQAEWLDIARRELG